MRFWRSTALGVPLAVVLAVAPARAVDVAAFHAAFNSITVSELGHHVDLLADDRFEGREAGSSGGRAAGGYLLQVLEELQLEPAGEGGTYVQSFGAGYRNILGMITGGDPKLRHEVIVIGAHYDHVGRGTARNSFGPTGQIHNGADDNASGTSGVLELVQAFTTLPEPPRRSILFAFWDGEEKGLLGSKHWTSAPTVPLDRIVFAFNADMIGRLQDNRVEVYGSRSAAGLRRLLSQHNAEFRLNLDFKWGVNADSDHYSFFERGIPVLMLHTGLHKDYHRPSDDTERINREGTQSVTQLMFCLAYELAEADAVPAFREDSRLETNVAQSEFERAMAPAPPRLGLSWGTVDAAPGLPITRVAADSPAAQAGLRIGDRVIRFNGCDVTDGAQFQLLVLAAPRATDIVILRPGDPEPQGVAVELRGEPVRVGIAWDEDVAESSVVMLTRVVPGSAADQAGLAPLDRVYAVDGQAFADAREFGQLVTATTQPVELLVERHGVLQTRTILPLAEAGCQRLVSDTPPPEDGTAPTQVR
ncbi:MAG: M20/M25/M40 family metallo-hydrolase [Pirellulaceae bacterium]|nr:M20/M25/M40 family metallo-hydrolase [Pirellulaceae bacterium]